MRVLNVTLDLSLETGGSAVAVLDFQRVCGGTIVSFDSRQWPQDHGLPAISRLRARRGPLGRSLVWVAKRKLRAIEEQLSTVHLAIVHKLFRYHNQWAMEFCSRRHIPYWVVPHGSLDPYVFGYRAIRKKAWVRVFGRDYVDGAQCVIFSSEREKEKAYGGLGNRNGVVLRWPVVGPAGARNPETRANVRHSIGVPDDARLLLMLGRLHSLKRPLEIIDALAQSRAEKAHLLIVGPADEFTYRDLEVHAAAKGVAHRVHFSPPAFGDGKWQFFAAADALINLSARENFGYTVAEAVSYGLCTILSPGNDLAKALAPAHCGWFLDTESIPAAATAIADFASTADLDLKQMGMRAREWARSNVSDERFRKGLNTLLESARNV